MPTGYTSDVKDGKIIAFKDYAELCLRSRGVAMKMLDEPLHNRVPDEMVIDAYYYEAVTKAERELAEVEDLEGEALFQATYNANQETKRRNLKYRQEQELTRLRYEAMLAEARAWNPPTPEHEDLKDFMVSQLEESLDFDCGHDYRDPDDLAPAEYKNQRLESARWHLQYSKDLLEKMEAKYANGTEYIRAFRASL